MTTFFDHKKIEKKWQEAWMASDLYSAKDNEGNLPAGKAGKKYILDMFPYPSGAGLHVGHPESYTATDIMARYYRFKGFNVLHPMGWDSFGLPAENYAIKTGAHPQATTEQSIENFRRQIKMLGFSYDWSREVNTSSPEYYKWTQWLFLQLYKKGLAYKKKAPVNWCQSCQTVLANEQVVDGKCERCSNPVVQKDLEQWFFKVTQYADELLSGMDNLDWSEALKTAQRNWIGKSEGAEIIFQLNNIEGQPDGKHQVKVFTTRPDTIFGATYLAVSPELAQAWLNIGWQAESKVVDYIKESLASRSKNKYQDNTEKTGVDSGIKAINPATKQEIPVWIADYVLGGYGTGAIMAVPAHDERDFDFATKFNLSIKEVVSAKGGPASGGKSEAGSPRFGVEAGTMPFSGEGVMVNSREFDGLDSVKAKNKIIKYVKGEEKVQYKIRDWLISRQRYWGAPIPIIYCDKCGEVPVPEKDLPVLLPDDVDFKPTGESPLARSESFHNVKCPKCAEPARRESDTMDTFVCSSWYFLRYCDPQNTAEIFDKKKVKFWLPVDLYIGGMEHAVGHLIYSRFIVKALRDLGFLDIDEPFLKIRNQGIILAEDGRKMSKRWNNVINPDDVVEEYGADSMRLYEMFMGPLEDTKPWSQKGIIGVRRFLEKVYKSVTKSVETHNYASQGNNLTEKLLHKTIKKVTEDIEAVHFNTAISAMMIFINEASGKSISQKDWEKFLIILSPFAPHLAEELWSTLGHQESIFLPCRQAGKQSWPDYDKKLVIDEEVTIAIQINGKLRETIKVERGINEKDLRIMVEELPNVKKYLDGQLVKKFIYIKDKLVNIVM
ncbi:MAG: leucine--tRNA ligase [Candidatus Komeilibacteria bacterium]|nr:leucine--tRNA ligase [Candidatus Komeilibacteria bacterium]